MNQTNRRASSLERLVYEGPPLGITTDWMWFHEFRYF